MYLEKIIVRHVLFNKYDKSLSCSRFHVIHVRKIDMFLFFFNNLSKDKKKMARNFNLCQWFGNKVMALDTGPFFFTLHILSAMRVICFRVKIGFSFASWSWPGLWCTPKIKFNRSNICFNLSGWLLIIYYYKTRSISVSFFHKISHTNINTFET